MIDIKVRAPRTKEMFALQGRIRNMSKDTDKITIGVQFEEINADAKARLESLLSQV